MFETLSQKFSNLVKNFRGLGRLTEENIQEALREVRIALLEGDVALSIVKQFIEEVRTRAIGQEVANSLHPGQVFIKIVHDELVKLMGGAEEKLNLNAAPPAIILIAGLQGSGKTTTVAKLAKYIKETLKKSVLVASCDIYRPAAIEQLETLAKSIDVNFHPHQPNQSALQIAQTALKAAQQQLAEVLILDTAGRLHIDEAMMEEIKQIHQAVTPIETLFVVDSLTGQDAANTAKAFSAVLPLTGVILTKLDGDSRGGAALSVRYITGKPIKFVGVGEKTDALEPFYPERLASRILDMGDVLSLVEQIERDVDKKEAEKLAKKLQKGKSFDLEDFLTQLQQMKKMGGLTGMLDKLPGVNNLPSAIKNQMDDKLTGKMEAIIYSMTPKERRFPDIIRATRKQRIAKGSGTDVQDVNRLLRQFEQMQKMMKRFSKAGGMQKMMRGMGNLGGMLPF